MKVVFTEKTLAAALFVMVLITFSFAQNETKKMEQQYGIQSSSIETTVGSKIETKANPGLVTGLASSVSNY